MTNRHLPRARWARSRALAFGSAMVASLCMACGDATDIERLEIGGTGVLFGQAFLDLDGDGSLSGGDQPIPGADVVLVTSTSARVVQLATTDDDGIFALFEVPVGTYRISLESDAVGDSLEAVGPDQPITIALGDTSVVALGVTYPTRSIEEIASVPPGRRVFTSGIALNARLNFDPTGRVHFAGASAFLRALNVERSGISAGDSVRLLGRVVSDNGRPALDIVTPSILVAGAALVLPRETTPGVAATADGGALDAALVRVRSVAVADTATSLSGDFRFVAVDGSDSVEVVLRSFLGLGTAGVGPDTAVVISQVTGLLSPVEDGTGAVRWRILPRGASDLTLQR